MHLLSLITFALTLLVSASLLFLLELMVGKMMMPLLGGTPAVWNTCMVFFQAVLLAGYGYAHAATRKLGARRMARWHLALLVVPFVSFLVNGLLFGGPLSPNQALVLARAGDPVTTLLAVLTLAVGVPFFVVTTSAPTLQRWFSATAHPSAGDPYFLYAASNLGSMATLLLYPIVIEPNFDLEQQAVAFTAGFVLLALLCGACALLLWRSPERATEAPATPDAPATPVGAARRVRWLLLAAVPSSLMLGATTYATTDIAAIPLLWVLPLALYLLSFVLVFQRFSLSGDFTLSLLLLLLLGGWVLLLVAPTSFGEAPGLRLPPAAVWGTTAVVVLVLGAFLTAAVMVKLTRPEWKRGVLQTWCLFLSPLFALLIAALLVTDGRLGSFYSHLSLHLFGLFVFCVACHGELAIDRPSPAHLTEFFLWMAFGGVLGSVFNGLIGPVVFNGHYEYPLMLAAVCCLGPSSARPLSGDWSRRTVGIAAALFSLALCALLAWQGNELLGAYREHVLANPNAGLSDHAVGSVSKEWMVAALFAAGMLALYVGWDGDGAWPDGAERKGEHVFDTGLRGLNTALDFAMPLALGLFCVGVAWGLPYTDHVKDVRSLAEGLGVESRARFVRLFAPVVPALLCLLFFWRPIRFGLGVAAILLVFGATAVLRDPPLLQTRGFYGVLQVEGREDTYYPSERAWDEYRERGPGEAPPAWRFASRRLMHGTTRHGEQFTDPDVRHVPLSYYHPTGPVGQVFRAYNDDASRAFGVIGLGTGTMTAYARPGQRVDVFEIDEGVARIAFDTDEHFTFVADAVGRGARVSMVLGDARLTLDTDGDPRPRRKPAGRTADSPEGGGRELDEPLTAAQRYRVLVVDAFSSDAIPVHLLTREAIELMLERLDDDGVLCVHISNRYLDLEPVLANIVAEIAANGPRRAGVAAMPGLAAFLMNDNNAESPGKSRSHWVAIVKRPEHFSRLTAPPPGRVAGPLQRELLAVSLFPWASAGHAACGGLALASVGIVDAEHARLGATLGEPLYPSPWRPLGMSGAADRLAAQAAMPGVSAAFGPADAAAVRAWLAHWRAPANSPAPEADLGGIAERVMEALRQARAEDKRLDEGIAVSMDRWRKARRPAAECTDLLFAVKARLEDVKAVLAKASDLNAKVIAARPLWPQVEAVLKARREAVPLIKGLTWLEGAEAVAARMAEPMPEATAAHAAFEEALDKAVGAKDDKARDALAEKMAAWLKAAEGAIGRFEREAYSPDEQGRMRPDCAAGLRFAAETTVDGEYRRSLLLARRIARLREMSRALDDLEKAARRERQAGVWTDGYSNLWAILTF